MRPPLTARHLAPLLALALIQSACVDVPARPDVGAIDAMVVDAAPDAPVCNPIAETCNGVDDDCDGRLDEADPGLCALCQMDGQQGACAEGRVVCADGVLDCRAFGAPPTDTCDLIDNDCDGRWDEADEPPALRDPLVARQCGPSDRAWGRAADPGACETPGEFGCGRVHPCLDGGCIARCDAQLGLALGMCGAQCEALPEAEKPPEGCRTRCRTENEPARQGCVAACPAILPNVERWQCAPGDGGPACTVAACAEGAVLEDGRCRFTEVCNNGVDDDVDGLVDGVLDAPGACQAVFEPAQTPIGACPPGVAGCDDVPVAHPMWSCGAECPYDPLVSYRYAIDREEVSNRAWHACYQAGACTEPAGLAWAQTRLIFQSELGPPDREPADACPDPIRLDPQRGAVIDRAVVDLPVTGVSWCQARDYCLWAGKRLPTEVEWERAASGNAPRRHWPWGEAPPAACSAAQCCGSDGEAPPECGPGPFPPCPEAPVGGPIRPACQATLGRGAPECGPPDADCPDCLPAPMPVWANADGDTPEGVRNLIGNVAEWTFDWASANYTALNDVDPVGAACTVLTSRADPDRASASQRVTRGGDFLRSGPPADALTRAPFPPGARLPGLGFRCARTVQTDDAGRAELCDPGRMGQLGPPPEPLRPGCEGPEFDDPYGAFGVCPLDVRTQSSTCTENQARICAFDDDPLDCGAFFTRELTVDFARLDALTQRIVQAFPGTPPFPQPTLDPVTATFIGRLLDGDLTPNGGRSLVAIETGCGFGDDGTFDLRLVNATEAAGRDVVEMGLADRDGNCTRLKTDQIIRVTVDSASGIDSVCHHGRGEIYVLGAAARIPYSGLALFDASLNVDRSRLSGTLLYAVSIADAADSSLGDDTAGGVRDFLTGVGAGPADLCVLQRLAGALDSGTNPLAEAEFGRWSCGDFLLWPGCAAGTCVGVAGDTSMCTGWLAPVRFEAIARDGNGLGLDSCSCNPEPEPPEPPPEQ